MKSGLFLLSETVTRTEEKYPRIDTHINVLLLTACFKLHFCINIHVPHRSIQHPVAVNLVIQSNLSCHTPRIFNAQIS